MRMLFAVVVLGWSVSVARAADDWESLPDLSDASVDFDPDAFLAEPDPELDGFIPDPVPNGWTEESIGAKASILNKAQKARLKKLSSKKELTHAEMGELERLDALARVKAELTDEQADKLNRALAGEEVELDDTEADVLNRAMAGQLDIKRSGIAPKVAPSPRHVVEWATLGALVLAVIVLIRKWSRVAVALRSTWWRLFVVAWPVWLYWRWNARLEEFNDPLYDEAFFGTVFQLIYLPPIAALAALWVSRATREKS